MAFLLSLILLFGLHGVQTLQPEEAAAFTGRPAGMIAYEVGEAALLNAASGAIKAGKLPKMIAALGKIPGVNAGKLNNLINAAKEKIPPIIAAVRRQQKYGCFVGETEVHTVETAVGVWDAAALAVGGAGIAGYYLHKRRQLKGVLSDKKVTKKKQKALEEFLALPWDDENFSYT